MTAGLSLADNSFCTDQVSRPQNGGQLIFTDPVSRPQNGGQLI